ncbi:MAG: hypothetical protein WC735_02705 [Candidatus Paceibacterota bacterium]|jgi:gas vesicle protein
MKNKKMSTGKKMAIGAGVVAASVASAGAYYLFGPKAKVHQKKAGALLVKMKKEVASEVKKAKEVSVPLYHKAVDVISKNYAKQYKMHEKEIKSFADKLKDEWKDVNKIVKKGLRVAKNKV